MASRKFMVLDVEATDAVKHTDGNAHPETSLVYDVGFIVADNKGNIYETLSAINVDTFYQRGLMESAYYANKLPQYRAGRGTEWVEMNGCEILHAVRSAIYRYGIKEVWAYNAQYDIKALNNTVEVQSNGYMRYFMPYNVEWRDIWPVAGASVCATKKYVKWALENGFTTASGNPRTNADTVAKYVYGDMNFEERHTALDDCKCELDILLACKRRKQKQPRDKSGKLRMGNGWREVKEIKATL